ncbi:MAG: ATP-dependent sacrificial sulfur transferase LarE [Lachnospiraceae bacterium]|jgi:uncharacterized protein|nr:ATP-dependent sacrificial sulfur transferase LarE [Lachnospiraceae bacterium]
MNLERFFQEHTKVALGFSGGVDSAYLLYAGIHYGADVRAYYVKTAFQPQFELEDARRLAKELGADLRLLELEVLQSETIAANPADRCYHCKNQIFGRICEEARKDGYPLILDGTNASDQVADRPGMRALAELQVRSPLRECGLTKQEIRRLSKEAGLFTWDKPAYACLATRVPTGMNLEAGLLNQVEQAETALTKLGFSDFRVRVTREKAARIQVPEGQLARLVEERQRVLEAMEPWFEAVLLDIKNCR